MKNIFKSFRRLVLCAALVCPLAVSCYDDTEIREQIDMIIDKIYELEDKLNNEINALQEMLKGNLMIQKIETDSQTGNTILTLSDGNTVLELLPEADMESFVTYFINSEGIPCWAYIDESGKTVPFMKDGDFIPITEIPEVVVEDDETFIVVGGEKYPMGGNSIFSSYELVTDELTGEIYAVVFTFGEGMTFTVTVEGAAGFHFVKSMGWSTVTINDYFVSNGLTDRVQVDARGVLDYVLQIPDGWRVEEEKDPFMGTMYFKITAPTKENVESGVAVAEGDLKVVAVLEGGKAVVAKLHLSTDPFKEFSVSYGKATVKINNGLNKYVYGVCEASQYDEATIIAEARRLIGDVYEYPAGYGVTYYDLDNQSLSELAGKPLEIGREYVFWAVPALYDESNEENPYYLAEGTFVWERFSYSTVDFTVENATNRDAQLTLNLQGVTAYYFNVVPKSIYTIEDVVYGLNNPGYYTARTSPLSYNGSVFEFAEVTAEPATEYVAWLAVMAGGKTYTAADVIVCEFATIDLTAGSDIKVVAGETKASPVDLVIPVTATGAEKIYYTYLTATEAAKYKTEEEKVTYLFSNCTVVDGESAEAVASEIMAVKPETDYVFMAVASDTDGKYGAVLTVECRTTAISYNDINVTLALEKNDPDNVVVSVTAAGAVDYLYWIGKTTDNVWRSPNYLGGSAAKAQGYMYLNSTADRFVNIMDAYPVVDGKITMRGLEVSKDYVIVLMAKDADGLYSKAVELKFVPNSYAIGLVVPKTDAKWAAAKPTIEWIEEVFSPQQGMMAGSYGFNITVPAGFTAYVLTATDAYFVDDLNPDKVLSVEEKIIQVIGWTDRSRDSERVVDLNAYQEKGYPYGHEFFHFEHGDPLFGNAVVWASKEYHDKVCGCKDDVFQRDYWGVKYDVQRVHTFNEGKPIEFAQYQAMGNVTEVSDRVFVVCQDLDGNCYETFEWDVPVELFQNAKK